MPLNNLLISTASSLKHSMQIIIHLGKQRLLTTSSSRTRLFLLAVQEHTSRTAWLNEPYRPSSVGPCATWHQLLHWPSCFQDDLWPFALDHRVNVWNYLPQSQSGLSPIELFTRTKWPHHNLISNAKVWGCPVYVLDPILQDGKRLPKSHLGMYVGSSPSHSDTITRFLSLETGYVSAQYHSI